MYFNEKRIVYINSKNRVSGRHEDFTFVINDITGHDRVVLLDCSIPKSFYSIDDTQYVTLVEDTNEFQINIESGNYTRKSFATTLQDKLNLAGSYTYQITYRNINQTNDNGKLLFTVSNNSGIQPKFIFGSSQTSLNEEMGFNPDTEYTFVADELESSNVIDLSGEQTIYIRSDICQDNQDNMLQIVYSNNDPAYSNIIYYCPNIQEYSKKITTNSSNIYRFWITTDDGKNINLNGQNIVMTLMIYKYNNVSDYVKRFILMKSME